MGPAIIAHKQARCRAGWARAHQTNACAAGEGHGQVVAVNHRHVVEVSGAGAATDAELSQRRGWLPGDGAVEGASAVAGITVAASATEGTVGAPPEPAGGASGHLDGPRPSWVQLRASADRDGCRPHRVAAVVFDGEGGRTSTGSEGCEDEEENRGHGSGRHGCSSQLFAAAIFSSSVRVTKSMSRAGGNGRGFIGVPVERRVDKSIDFFCFHIM